MDVLRYSAFTATPDGGNPAGVVMSMVPLPADQMLAVAAEVGFSETAFLVGEGDVLDVRYFSPKAEVSFCGHATIASAVALAERRGAGRLVFRTPVGEVPVVTSRSADGVWQAALTSVPPSTTALEDADLDELLAALGWQRTELDRALPPRVAYAGAYHPVLAAATRQRLADLDYDVARLGRLMAERGWTTVQLVWRERDDLFHARNPFPPGGVVEDPATGAAAAALGGYLREGRHVSPPVTLTVLQGHDLGRPSVLTVLVEDAPTSGITVIGNAVRLP